MIVNHRKDDNTETIFLSGRVDATTAPEVEDATKAILDESVCDRLVLDCDDLAYLSSAGIRVVLRLAKRVRDIRLVNVQSDVYEVLDMCGLTEMLDVAKAFRRVIVEGCTLVGQGAKGMLYRLDPETICKVYRNPDSLPEINRERELARAAFVAGIPTAIPYDVVRVGEGYGSVFELLDADTLGDLLVRGVWSIERVASASASLLRQMATTEVDPEVMPSARDEALAWVEDVAPVVDEATMARLRKVVAAVPDEPHMVHGDFHVKNVMVQNGEPLLIDMDTLSHGNPIFDLSATYNTYVGRGLVTPDSVERFLGIPYEEACHLWDLILHDYYAGRDEDEIRAEEDKIRLMSAIRLMGWPLRHGDSTSDYAKKAFATYAAVIDETLGNLDTIAL